MVPMEKFTKDMEKIASIEYQRKNRDYTDHSTVKTS